MKYFSLVFISFISVALHAQVCIPNTSSLKFNGNSDYVQINSNVNLELDSAVSVEAWIKPTAWGTDYWDNTIFCKHSWSTGEQGYVLRCGGDAQLSFNFAGYANGPTSWKDVVSGANALQLDVWQHVAGTFDGFRMRLFVNGIMVADSLFVGTMVPSTTYNPCIGRLSDFGSFETRYFKGKIDEVRVWNRSLSPDEILQHMSVHLDPSQQTGLVGYWRLNDSTGTLVSDISGNANDGTKYGAAWQLDDVPFNNAATIPTITQSGDLLISSHSSAYQWFWNGDAINGATDQTYLATQSGFYSVQITDSIGCSAVSDTLSIIPTGIHAIDDDNLNVLGNPVSDVLMVEIKTQQQNLLLSLVNALGEVVYESKLVDNPSHFKIDVSGFSEGIYYLTMKAACAMSTKKIVIQR